MGAILDVSSEMMIEEFENDDDVEGEGEGVGEPFSREAGSPVSAVPPGGTSVYVRYRTVDMNGAMIHGFSQFRSCSSVGSFFSMSLSTIPEP